MRQGNPMNLTGVPQRKPQENDAIPKIAPKWLKYDRQVSIPSYDACLTILFVGALIRLLLPRTSGGEPHWELQDQKVHLILLFGWRHHAHYRKENWKQRHSSRSLLKETQGPNTRQRHRALFMVGSQYRSEHCRVRQSVQNHWLQRIH